MSANEQFEELADTLGNAEFSYNEIDSSDEATTCIKRGTSVESVAELLIAAGYRKPRTISTADELDALPHHTMIHTADGDHAEHVYDQWFIPGVNYAHHSRTIALPATVLYEPQP